MLRWQCLASSTSAFKSAGPPSRRHGRGASRSASRSLGCATSWPSLPARVAWARVNLAVALAQQGLRVGLVDADIHGPNLPRMLGLQALPEPDGGRLQPAVAYGVKVMSMAFLAPGETPVIWRGPMIDKAIRQFFHDVDWGELDTMIVDLPPGTGDAQLSLVQRIPLDGAVIVSTPQAVAWDDALKGLKMFQQMNVPVLGVIENMSYFDCPGCGQRHDIFGSGGSRTAAEQLGLPLLATLPLEPAVRAGGDEGRPSVLDPNSRVGQALRQAAGTLYAALPESPVEVVAA